MPCARCQHRDARLKSALSETAAKLSALACAITGPAFPRKRANVFSTDFSQPRQKGSGWDWRLYGRSWNHTPVRSRPRMRKVAARDFISRSQLKEPDNMIPPNSLVFAIDDDASVRTGLNRL